MQRANSLLSVMGAINWDISIFEDRQAREGEEVQVRMVEEFSGGKGANTAVAAARILGKNKVAFIGALGRDDIATRQMIELRKEGVITDGVVSIKGISSGRAYIIINGRGRKTIHTHFGANERITPRHIREKRIADIIRSSKITIVMDLPIDTAEAAINLAKNSGSKVIYSPGVRTQLRMNKLRGLIEKSDYLVVDRIELMNLYPNYLEEQIIGILTRDFQDLTLITTMGEKGCLISNKNTMHFIPGINLSVLSKSVVNTTGCGDAFLGVFASYLMMGSDLIDAVNWANLAGALKASRYETRGSPTRDELEKSMKRLLELRMVKLRS